MFKNVIIKTNFLEKLSDLGEIFEFYTTLDL